MLVIHKAFKTHDLKK